jgi:hypothetical protein
MPTPTSLPFTGNDAADRLLVDEPLALLIGFALDQQITVQKAFSGPLDIQHRIGHLDAARIAAMDPADLDRVFRDRPAIHRFPGSMAGKIQALCAAIARDYGNDAARVWTGGVGWPRPRGAPASASRHRRDEGEIDHRRAWQAIWRSATRVRGCGSDVADAWRRRFGRGAGRVSGRQARPQGRAPGGGQQAGVAHEVLLLVAHATS